MPSAEATDDTEAGRTASVPHYRQKCVQSCKLTLLPLAKVDAHLPSLPAQRHLHIFSLQLFLQLLFLHRAKIRDLFFLPISLQWRDCPKGQRRRSTLLLPLISTTTRNQVRSWQLCFPPCVLQREWSVSLCSLVRWDGMLLSSRPAQAGLRLIHPWYIPILLTTGYGVDTHKEREITTSGKKRILHFTHKLMKY